MCLKLQQRNQIIMCNNQSSQTHTFCVCSILEMLSRYFTFNHSFEIDLYFDIVSKYNVGLKTLLLQGLSEPEFYGDLVYKFRKIIVKMIFLIISKR